MTPAFVLGNARSRQAIDIKILKNHGTVYGCNALYREFVPDVLIAADRQISETIQHSGYAQQNKFYTRKPLPGLGAKRIPDHYWGYSSGQIATAIACIDRHTPIFLIGFDLGSVDTHFNNVYANTEFYKTSAARPTYAGNWIRQLIQIAKDFPECKLVRVTGPESVEVPNFAAVTNIEHMNIKDFCSIFAI
jgi:hypothetical protein